MDDTFYSGARWQAEQDGKLKLWEQNRQENIQCARHIKDLIIFHALDDQLEPDCARAALDRWSFRRVQYVLPNAVLGTGVMGFEPESVKWVKSVWMPPDNDNATFRLVVDRPLLAQFVQQTYAEYQKLGLFGPEHCNPAPGQDYTGKVLILRLDRLNDECWSAQNQLWYGQTGFELSPTSKGRAVFATCLGDGEKASWNRSDFIGVLDEQYLPDWAQEKLVELRGPAQEQAESSATEQADAPAQGGMEMR